MKCVISILNLQPEKAKIGLFKIGEIDTLQFKRVMNLNLADGMFNKILPLLVDQLLEAEISDGEINDVSKLNDIPKVVVDSFSLIKSIVKEAGGKITKKDFYESYVKEANVTKRTAENHLAQALGLGVVSSDGYYGLCLKDVKLGEEVIKDEKERTEEADEIKEE